MEEQKEQSRLTQVFDAALWTVLVPYLKLEAVMNLSAVCRELHELFGPQSPIDAAVWSPLVLQDFPLAHTPEYHKAPEDANHCARFKRMFAKYQRARRVVRKIVCSNLNNKDKLLSQYLKPFRNRSIPLLLATSVEGPYSLDFECLYKNLQDPLGLATFNEV